MTEAEQLAAAAREDALVTRATEILSGLVPRLSHENALIELVGRQQAEELCHHWANDWEMALPSKVREIAEREVRDGMNAPAEARADRRLGPDVGKEP